MSQDQDFNIGEAAFIVSTSASYARRDAVSPFQAMAIRVAITGAGVGLALTATSGTALIWALCLSLSVANLVSATYLYWCQVRALPAATDARGYPLLGDAAASVVSTIPGVIVAGWLQDALGHGYGRVGVALAAVATSAIVYLGLQRVRGSAELRAFVFGIRSPQPSGGAGIAEGAEAPERADSAGEHQR